MIQITPLRLSSPLIGRMSIQAVLLALSVGVSSSEDSIMCSPRSNKTKAQDLARVLMTNYSRFVSHQSLHTMSSQSLEFEFMFLGLLLNRSMNRKVSLIQKILHLIFLFLKNSMSKYVAFTLKLSL